MDKITVFLSNEKINYIKTSVQNPFYKKTDKIVSAIKTNTAKSTPPLPYHLSPILSVPKIRVDAYV